MLPRQFGNVSVEVAEVISDTEVKVKKAFPSKVLDGIRERGEKGVSFKVRVCRSSPVRAPAYSLILSPYPPSFSSGSPD